MKKTTAEYSDDQPRDDQGRFASGGGGENDASSARFNVTNPGDEPFERGEWSDDRSSTDAYAQKNFNAIDGRSTDLPPTCPHKHDDPSKDGVAFKNYSDYNDHIVSDHRDKVTPGFVRVQDSFFVTEPLHPDFKKVRDAMRATYSDSPRTADSIYFAWKNRHKLDDTKPMPSWLSKEAFEDLATIAEKLLESFRAVENRIFGVLAPPRVSRNDNLYLPEMLSAGDGKTIPFYDEHEDFEKDENGRPTGQLLKLPPKGAIKLKWNDDMKRLEYEGDVWDKDLIRSIRSGVRPYVSLAAEPDDFETYRGHQVPVGLNFISASAVADPGIPETTLTMEGNAAEVVLTGFEFPRKLVVIEGLAEYNGSGAPEPRQAEPSSKHWVEPISSRSQLAYPFGLYTLTPMTTARPEIPAVQPGPIATTIPRTGNQAVRPLLHSDANKSGTEDETTFMSKATVKEEEAGDASSAQDTTAKKAASVVDAPVKNIGAPKTTFEEEEEEHPEETDSLGQAGPPPPPAQKLRGQTTGAGGDVDKEEEEETYGYAKEEWSTMSRTERRAARTAYETASTSARKIAQSIVQKALEDAGLRKSGTTLASKRESRAGGPDVVANSLFAEYGIDAGVNGPEIQEALAVIQGKSKSGHVVVRVPLLSPPRLSKVNPKARLEFAELLESYTEQRRFTVEAAIATSTSGAALGVDEITPALVVPTNLAALLRDTVLFRALPQGVDRARFQTVTIPAAGSLTEDTEPSQSTQTLTTVDTTTSPRGVETDISFEAERKIIGPILDAMILADRLSELYDEDGLILGSVGSGGFENALSNVPAASKYYGDGTVSAENQITSTMVFAAKAAAFAQKAIKTQGYAPDNLVLVLHPKQFNDLLNDTNIVRYLQWWFGSSDSGQSLIAQGIIPNLYGLEVRQSTLVKTATGTTAGVTTYHSWAYKKGLSAAMAASRDVMIETFRDIRKNATVLKAHWDIGVNVLHPASTAFITTA